MLLFADSFDHYPATTDAGLIYASMRSKWTGTVLGNPGPILGAGRRGTAAMPVANMVRNHTPAAEVILGIALNCTKAPITTRELVWFVPPLTSPGWYGYHVRVCLDPTLKLYFENYDGTVLSAKTAALPVGQWSYVEIRVLISATVGTWEIRFDGQTKVKETGKTTKMPNPGSFAAIDATVGQVRLLNGLVSGSGTETLVPLIDDLYLASTSGGGVIDFLGDVNVDVHLPTGAGSSATWTPSVGTDNFARVNTVHPTFQTGTDGPSEWTHTTAPDALDSFPVSPAIVPAGSALVGVQVLAWAFKSGPGTKVLQPVVKTGATSAGSAIAVNRNPNIAGQSGIRIGAPTYTHWIFETNPVTSAAWTAALFNASEFGYQSALGPAGTVFYVTAPPSAGPTLTKKGAWDLDPNAATTYSLDTTPSGQDGSVVASALVSLIPQSVRLLTARSAALKAQTLSGTLDVCFRAWVTPTPTQAFWAMHLYLTAGDTNVRRAVLVDYAESGVLWGPDPYGKGFVASQAIPATAVQEGDRLVVELGAVIWAAGTPSIALGGQNPTLIPVSYPQQMQFSAGLVFATGVPLHSNSIVPDLGVGQLVVETVMKVGAPPPDPVPPALKKGRRVLDPGLNDLASTGVN
jgi:hypothetical protein